MTDQVLDGQEIRELAEDWVVWRDTGDWERLRTLWHPGGRMAQTWFQGPFEEFIEATAQAFDQGVHVLHFLGGSSIDVAGDRAIAQTKMTVSQRAPVDGVLSDVVCAGRFYDFLERRDGRWGIVLRQLIYERDRIDPVDPAARLELPADELAQFPEGYRHIGYLQATLGYPVRRDLPGLTGAEVEALYQRGARWLSGGPCD
jgi:hypothetical protein